MSLALAPSRGGGGILLVFFENLDGVALERDVDSGQRVISEHMPALEIAGDSAVGLSHGQGAESSGDFLLDLAHTLHSFSQIVCKRAVGMVREAQDIAFIFPQRLGPVMSIGLGLASALAGGWWLVMQFPNARCQDAAVLFAQCDESRWVKGLGFGCCTFPIGVDQ